MESIEKPAITSNAKQAEKNHLVVKIGIKRLLGAVAAIREVAPEIGIQAVHLLLEVARKPGITVSELISKTGLSQSSCSRNLALLSAQHRLGKPGLNLVYTQDDPKERRRKLAYLTEKVSMAIYFDPPLANKIDPPDALIG
ncbi:MarR family transcriptional regulator [Marinospirillum perlucidum]|uniref:MarR family transcriptional regulator n=1 Tax=Marinospirillum perlucidum TaxID=1982602 RepID=UPI000DF119A4|nr:helix-turn-helix domain-containing protein [Marinospirillum perlucidum]